MHIILYDGVCGMCNRLVWFVLKHDKKNLFLFAPLQGGFAKKMLSKYRKSPDLDTMFVIAHHRTPDEQLLQRSQAIFFILAELYSLYKLLGIIPAFLADPAYTLIAKRRYRLFGKHTACLLPGPKHRKKFLR